MKRKLTEEARKAIRRSFYERIKKGASVQDQAYAFADHACDLLELPEGDTAPWWEDYNPYSPEARAGDCLEGRHASSVMGHRGDETVAICRECGEAHSMPGLPSWHTWHTSLHDCLPPCPACGVCLTDKNPYSGLCMYLHTRRCGKG